MTMKHTGLKRLLAGAGAFALAVTGALAMSTTAGADQGTDGTAPGNADEGTTGTLYVHKYAGSTTGQDNNGTELTDGVERPPLEGVTFEVCAVAGFDPADPADWAGMADLDATSAECDGTPISVPTNGDGVASFPNLAMGLYKVHEGASANVTVTTPANDFLVSIPFPSEGSDGATTWLWTVYTYPKNTISGDGSKTVGDPDAHGLGELVPWTIQSRGLGSFDGGAPLTEYRLIDRLNENLRYEATTSLQFMVPGGALAEVDPSYYTIDPAAAATAGGDDVTIEFTSAGLDWLNGLVGGSYLVWDLTTEVVGVGVLDNKSFENSGDEDVQTGEATTDWGAAKLLKHDANDEGKVLAGAEFQVYDVNADGTCPADPEALEGSPLEVDGETTFVSDEDGVVDIPGLYVGKDGDPADRDYCVVETKAPVGYTLVETPILINVTPGAVADGTWSAEVPNPPAEGPELPLTGAGGTLAMTIAGLLLVGGGVAAILVSRRRHGASH